MDDDITVLEHEDRPYFIPDEEFNQRFYIGSGSLQNSVEKDASMHALQKAYQDLKLRYNEQKVKNNAMTNYIQNVDTQRLMQQQQQRHTGLMYHSPYDGEAAAGYPVEQHSPSRSPIYTGNTAEQLRQMQTMQQNYESKQKEMETKYSDLYHKYKKLESEHLALQAKYQELQNEHKNQVDLLTPKQESLPLQEKRLLSMINEQSKYMANLSKKVKEQSQTIQEQTVMLKKVKLMIADKKSPSNSLSRKGDGASMHFFAQELGQPVDPGPPVMTDSATAQMDPQKISNGLPESMSRSTFVTPGMTDLMSRSAYDPDIINRRSVMNDSMSRSQYDPVKLNSASIMNETMTRSTSHIHNQRTFEPQGSVMQSSYHMNPSVNNDSDNFQRKHSPIEVNISDSSRTGGYLEGNTIINHSVHSPNFNLNRSRTSQGTNRVQPLLDTDDTLYNVVLDTNLPTFSSSSVMNDSRYRLPTPGAEDSRTNHRVPAQGREENKNCHSPRMTSTYNRRPVEAIPVEHDSDEDAIQVNVRPANPDHVVGSPYRSPQRKITHPSDQALTCRGVDNTPSGNQVRNNKTTGFLVGEIENGVDIHANDEYNDYENISNFPLRTDGRKDVVGSNVSPPVQVAIRGPASSTTSTNRGIGQQSQMCPICKNDFSGMPMAEFQLHAFDCVDNTSSNEEEQLQTLRTTPQLEQGSRECFMCNAIFPPGLPQEEFERHVQEHFAEENINQDFEILGN